VEYNVGCDIMHIDESNITKAAQLAATSDLAVVVVGDSLQSCGESYSFVLGDRASLDLSGSQLKLIDTLIGTNTPVIVVLVNGRPQTFGFNNTLLDKIDTLLVAWRPGEEGGTAVADVIFGYVNPNARLVSTWPRSVGQIGGPSQPYYKKKRQYFGALYAFEEHTPLFPFGFGLSYTTFAYSDLILSPTITTATGTVTISITIRNTGFVTGAEIVQFYVSDPVASVVRYNKQLAGFKKVIVPYQQQVKVTFDLVVQDLAFYNANNDLVVEPGEFIVYAGKHSGDESNKASFYVL